MDRPRLIRGLRIAWTVGWGILCVLLIVLWVRSYDKQPQSFHTYGVVCHSMQGNLSFWRPYIEETRTPVYSEVIVSNWSPQKTVKIVFPVDIFGFKLFWQSWSFWIVQVPYLYPVLLFATFAAAPWIRWSRSISLRTLLIVTTLIAIVLGLVVYVTR